MVVTVTVRLRLFAWANLADPLARSSNYTAAIPLSFEN